MLTPLFAQIPLNMPLLLQALPVAALTAPEGVALAPLAFPAAVPIVPVSQMTGVTFNQLTPRAEVCG